MDDEKLDPKPTETDDQDKETPEVKDESTHDEATKPPVTPPEDDDDIFIKDESETEPDKKEKDDKDDDEDIDDSDKKIIASEVDKRMAPLVQTIESQKREAELQSFLSTEEGKVFQPFADKIRQYQKHPSLKGLKLSAIAYAAAGKNLLKIGADMAVKAKAEADNGNISGNSTKPADNGAIVDVTKMTRAEFEAHKNSILRRPR